MPNLLDILGFDDYDSGLEEGTKSDEFNFKRLDFWDVSYRNARILKIWEDVNVLEDELLSKTSKN